MPNFDPTREFHDELLSAYLDDELAPEECARVEQRLATDPRAKQLLDELRAVSQAMKSVPSATVGSDLCDSVLRRAERAMLVPGERAPAGGVRNLVRRLPFGRSKRAWVWAGVALAAGLMLMFFDREPERNQGLPAVVAERDRAAELKPLAVEQSSASGEVETLAVGRPAAPASAPAAALKTSRLAVADGYQGGVGGSAAAIDGREAEASDNQEQMIVYVNVKPEALRSRAFDAVLARNQIEVEPSAVSDLDKSKSAGELQEPQEQEPQEVDLLLLEAAPEQIASTLAELKADHTNYLDIEVEAERAGSQRSGAAERSDYDFKQYNRGVVPLQQKQQNATNRNFYYQTEQGSIDVGRSLGREVELEQRRLSDDQLSESVQSRAVRLQPQSVARSGPANEVPADEILNRSGAIATRPPAAAPALGYPYGGGKLGLARRAKQELAAKAEMLQVLFVLTAGTDSTTDQPATAKADTSSTAEEGLKSDER